MSSNISKIIKAVSKLSSTIEKEVDLSENELNSIASKEEMNNLYDETQKYRKEIIDQGYRIHKMIAVYYQGWECDFWSFIVSKDGKKYKAESSHGTWSFKEIVE